MLKRGGIDSQQSHKSQFIQSNLVSVHNLLAQIITLTSTPPAFCKEKKLGIIIEYKNTSEPPADFMRTLLHRSAELSSMSSLKAYRHAYKGRN